jgi:hypothetical protein
VAQPAAMKTAAIKAAGAKQGRVSLSVIGSHLCSIRVAV